MVKNEKYQGIVSGILVVLLALILFILVDEKDAHFWTYLIFSIIAIMSPFAILVMNRLSITKDSFLGRPSHVLGLLYLGVQVVLGFILLLIKVDFKYFILFQLILLFVFLLLLTSANFIKTRTEQVEESYKARARFRDEAQLLMSNLLVDVKDEPTRKQLESIIDKLRYSDPISVSESNDVEEKILDLVRVSATAGSVTENTLNEVNDLLLKRENILKSMKR